MSLSPRREGVPNHSEAEVLVELYGPENDGWYSSRILDWISLCDDLRDPDTRGYLVLRALVYEKYKKPIRNLTLSLLCELIPGPNGKASSQGRVRGILKALSDVGLVSTPEGGPLKTSSRASAAGKPLRIRINDMPQEGYPGWRNAEAKLKWLQAGKPFMGAGQNSDPVCGSGEDGSEAGRNSDPRGSNSDPHSGSDLRKREHPLVPSIGASDALSGRSPGDARRASTGSSACEGEGGFAASGKTSPSPTQHDDTRRPAQDPKGSSKKAAHTREQLDVVRRVRAFYPPEIREQLPELPAISEAILSTMAKEGRSVEQMGQRILSRWVGHNYAAKFAAGELVNVVGAAIGMVRPLVPGDRYACSDVRCEDGVLDGEPCRLCTVRIADWEAARSRQRTQKRPTVANTAPVGAGSPDPVMPPQRAVERHAPESVGCSGKGGTCDAGLGFGQTLCWVCAEAAAEQYDLENAGAPAPF